MAEPFLSEIRIMSFGFPPKSWALCDGQLMPINQKYPIEEVLEAVRSLPGSRRKRVMFEYVMIKGVTDSLDDARVLSGLLHGLGSKVNLIALNESPDLDFHRADREDILRFQQLLLENDIPTFIRKTRGDDVYGACGQLKKQGRVSVKE